MKVSIAFAGLAFCILTQPLLAQTAVERVVVPALKNTEIQRQYISRRDFEAYRGDYSLSNGKELRLKHYGGKMYAQIGGQSEHEIVRTSKGTFAALDRTMHMQLDVDRYGDVTGTLTYIDEDLQKTAGLPPEAALIAVVMQ